MTTLKEMYDEAMQLFYDGKYMRSLSLANRLYGKAEVRGDRVYVIRSLTLVSLDLFVLQDYEYSLSEYLELIDTLENNKPEELDDEWVNNARYGAALCYLNLGNLAECFQYLKTVIENTNNNKHLVNSYLMLGETLRSNYEINKDASYLEELYSYLEVAFESAQEQEQLGFLYNVKGRALATEGKIDEALECYLKSIEAHTSKVYIPANLNEIAYCYMMLDKNELALEYLEKTWQGISDLSFSDDREKARYYFILGLYYKKQNDYTQAIEKFLKSEELCIERKVCVELATIYYEMGRIFEKMEQPKRAGENYCKYELYKEKVLKLGGKL